MLLSRVLHERCNTFLFYNNTVPNKTILLRRLPTRIVVKIDELWNAATFYDDGEARTCTGRGTVDNASRRVSLYACIQYMI